MTSLGGWQVRGHEPQAEPDQTAEEMQEQIWRLEEELDWFNAWANNLL